MTQEVLKQGIDIDSALNYINTLNTILKAENISITGGSTLSIAYLDKETRQELLKAMKDVLKEREEILKMELEEL